MVYCRECGEPVSENALYCSNCGARQSETVEKKVDDDGSIIWFLIGLIIPIIGIVLWLVWMDSKPKCSKRAGMGALIGIVAVSLINYAVFFAVMR